MPTFIYPEAGAPGSPVEGSPVITVGEPSARQYDATTYEAVKLPSFTVTGEGNLTAMLTVIVGSGDFRVGTTGSPTSQLMITGDAETISADLSDLYFLPGNGEKNDIAYTVEVDDSEGRTGTSGELRVVNSSLFTEGAKASTTVTISGSSGSIRLTAGGRPISASVNYQTSLSSTVTALVTAVNDFSGSPKYTATKIGSDQIKLEAPLGLGASANGTAISADVTGTMAIDASGRLSGGVTKVEPELDWTGKLLEGAKKILPTAAGALATNLILRNMSKVEVEVTVENENEQPDVSVLYDCQLISVPVGYTPPQLDDNGNWTPAVYPGSWDFQTFATEKVWTANPAWCWLDLLSSKRYGAGNSIQLTPEERIRIHKQVWEASKRCDELVRTGFNTDASSSSLEPRYAIHTLINGLTRKEALESVASVFDAVVVYSDDGVHLKMDAPDSAKRLVTNANVGAGEFKYSGGSLSAMYNWVEVTYNNPDKFYNLEAVYAADTASIIKFGEKKTAVHAFGCASVGQAKRKARYVMLNEKSNPLVVSYVASWDHHDLVRGDLVAIVNNTNKPMGSVHAGGRINTPTSTTVLVLDRVIQSNTNGYLHITMDDGSIATRKVSSITNVGNKSRVTLASALPAIPEKNAVWVYYSQNLNPITFKIIQKTERSMGIWEISAVAYDASKYTEMDNI